MRVTDIVTGHYLKEGDQLQITVEAVDVANNRTVWRTPSTSGALDMIAMRAQITSRVRQGLLPALGTGENSTEAGTHPRNEEAYDLYLRSVSLPHDSVPNKDAITMLERAVGLDPTYAPAWVALGFATVMTHTTRAAARRCSSVPPPAYERARGPRSGLQAMPLAGS